MAVWVARSRARSLPYPTHPRCPTTNPARVLTSGFLQPRYPSSPKPLASPGRRTQRLWTLNPSTVWPTPKFHLSGFPGQTITPPPPSPHGATGRGFTPNRPKGAIQHFFFRRAAGQLSAKTSNSRRERHLATTAISDEPTSGPPGPPRDRPVSTFRAHLNLSSPFNLSSCRVTSLTRKFTRLGPYRRPMPRVLGGT